MNERIERTRELAVVSHKSTGERIEVYPDFYVYRTITVVRLTDAGLAYVRNLCNDYRTDKVSVEEVLNDFRQKAEETSSGYRFEVEEKLYYEFIDMLSN